jgi:DNA polymerase-3 subunit epsilon
MKNQESSRFNLDEVLEFFKAQDIRFTVPFSPRKSYCNNKPSSRLLKAAILDTETTGTNPLVDKIIELGIVIVEYCPDTGQVYRVLETFDELEYPGIPIPAESTKIHGITDEMVNNTKINDSYVESLMADVSLVIAHNAIFDRVFVESRFPFFQKKAWACSFAQIPWKAEGFGSAGLEFLAYRFGFHFTGHRASVDCHALLEVLQSDMPGTGTKVLKLLLDKARIPDLKIWALNSSFESKDKLKERGYRWDGGRKTWCGTIAVNDFEDEKNWLKTEIYSNRPFKIERETMDAFNRFSNRAGKSETISLV